jgi:hypothetical protein
MLASLRLQASSGSDYTASRLYASVSTGSFESTFDLSDSASNRRQKKPRTWDEDLSAQFSIDSMSRDTPFNADIMADSTQSNTHRTRRATAMQACQRAASLPVAEPFAPPAPVLSHPLVNSMGVALGMPCFGPVAMPVRHAAWTAMPLPPLAGPSVMQAASMVQPDLREVLAAKATQLPIGLKLDCAAILKELNAA